MIKKRILITLLFLITLIIGCGNKTLPTSSYNNLNLSSSILLYNVEAGFAFKNLHSEHTLYIIKSENGGEEIILNDAVPPLGLYIDRDVKQGAQYRYTLKYGNIYSKQFNKVFSRPVYIRNASIEEYRGKTLIFFDENPDIKQVNVNINGVYLLSAQNNRIYIDESLDSIEILKLEPVDIYGNSGPLYILRFDGYAEEGFEYLTLRKVKDNTLVADWSYIGDVKNYELKLFHENTTLYQGYSSSYTSSIDVSTEKYDCLILSIKPLKPDNTEGKVGFVKYCK